MWMWSEQEKHIKFLKIAKKWMEFGTNVEDLDEDILDAAFSKSQQMSKKIVDTLEIKTPETNGFISAWVELGLFVGFIAGWKDACDILPQKPLSVTLYATNWDIYTAVDWATPWAADYAFIATEEVFTKIMTPPVSPLIESFGNREIDTLRETYERSLFTGYLVGLEYAEKDEKCPLSVLDKLGTLEM